MSNHFTVQTEYNNYLKQPDRGTILAGAETDIRTVRMAADSFMAGDGVALVGGVWKRVTADIDRKDLAGVVTNRQMRAPGETDDGFLEFEILVKGKIYVELSEDVKANDQAMPSLDAKAGLWGVLNDAPVVNPMFYTESASAGQMSIVVINGRVR